MNVTIRLSSSDNVVVAKKLLEAGIIIEEEGIMTLQQIPAGHKVACISIKKGEPVVKYGETIGYAKAEIQPGEYVHIHNLKFDEVNKDFDFCRDYQPVEVIPQEQRETFDGIIRKSGKVGTRNYIGIFSTSNCSATVVRRIADYFTKEKLEQYPNVDGVVPFIHGIGCAMEGAGEPMDLLRRTISGHIKNPNIAGAVVVALGCERNNIDVLFETEVLKEGSMLRKLVIQECGGTRKTTEMGIEFVKEMLPVANDITRESVSAEHLILALQCGGSDAFSGLTANPALGCAADQLVRNGGTVILSETTEVYGSEHLLTRRAATPEVASKLLDVFNWWLDHTKGKICQMTGTVSPGNIEGGLSNVLEKALGGVKKCGESPLMDVCKYGELIRCKGFVFMDTAAHDPVSVTGQIAGGANVVTFTTGRGSCFGSVPVPSIKLASNTKMYNKMEEDMDINCGEIMDGTKTIKEMGDIIFKSILETASGKKTKSEEIGVGENEFVPWDIGIEG